VAAILATTLPTFLLHNPPARVPHALRLGLLVALLGGIAWWIGRALHRGRASSVPHMQGRTHNLGWWGALGAIAVLAVAVRAPLAWADPGISDIPQASELAARQLLGGVNPYTVPNRYTVVGAYQYPAGSVLAHLPFVALLPPKLLGEAWLPARTLLWTASAGAVLLLGWAAARAAGPRAGLAAGLAAAVHPTLVRESALTVANDVLVGLAVAAAVVALASGRRAWSGALIGLAVSVKPAALVLVPFAAVGGGAVAAAAGLAVPALAQAPFLLWPAPGLHGVAAMLEPAARLDPPAVLHQSLWWPLYATVPPTAGLLRLVAVAGIAAATAAAVWAGARVRHEKAVGPVALAVALPLLVAFALGHRLRLNFQDWYLVPFLLGAVQVRTERAASAVTATAAAGSSSAARSPTAEASAPISAGPANDPR
jgi:hypothetical protein